MVFFGYSAKGRFTPEVSLHVVDREGGLKRSQGSRRPIPSMIHDFAVTRNWIVLPIFPLTGSMERAMKGLPPFAWEPDKGTHIAFMPRNGTVAEVRWFSADPCYVFHPMNDFETRRRQGGVRRDEVRGGAALPAPDGSPRQRSSRPRRRWSAGPSTRPATATPSSEQQLDDRAGEFPRFDERFAERLPARLDSRPATSPTPARAAERGRPRALRPRQRQVAPGSPVPPTAAASRCSCRAAPTPPKATAWC